MRFVLDFELECKVLKALVIFCSVLRITDYIFVSLPITGVSTGQLPGIFFLNYKAVNDLPKKKTVITMFQHLSFSHFFFFFCDCKFNVTMCIAGFNADYL